MKKPQQTNGRKSITAAPMTPADAEGVTSHYSAMAVDYTKERITIGTPTDIKGMKVTLLKQGEKPKEKPVRFNDTIFKPKSELVKRIEEDAQKKEKADKRKKYDYQKADELIHDPKYQWEGSPDIVLIAHETGIPCANLYRRYGSERPRGRRPVYDYAQAEVLAKDKKYQKKNGRPHAAMIAQATGVSANALRKHFNAKERRG